MSTGKPSTSRPSISVPTMLIACYIRTILHSFRRDLFFLQEYAVLTVTEERLRSRRVGRTEAEKKTRADLKNIFNTVLQNAGPKDVCENELYDENVIDPAEPTLSETRSQYRGNVSRNAF